MLAVERVCIFSDEHVCTFLTYRDRWNSSLVDGLTERITERDKSPLKKTIYIVALNFELSI